MSNAAAKEYVKRPSDGTADASVVVSDWTASLPYLEHTVEECQIARSDGKHRVKLRANKSEPRYRNPSQLFTEDKIVEQYMKGTTEQSAIVRKGPILSTLVVRIGPGSYWILPALAALAVCEPKTNVVTLVGTNSVRVRRKGSLPREVYKDLREIVPALSRRERR